MWFSTPARTSLVSIVVFSILVAAVGDFSWFFFMAVHGKELPHPSLPASPKPVDLYRNHCLLGRTTDADALSFRASSALRFLHFN